MTIQPACKEVVSGNPGLLDFAIGLVILVVNLSDGQVLFFWEIQMTEGFVLNPANQKGFRGWFK